MRALVKELNLKDFLVEENELNKGILQILTVRTFYPISYIIKKGGTKTKWKLDSNVIKRVQLDDQSFTFLQMI